MTVRSHLAAEMVGDPTTRGIIALGEIILHMDGRDLLLTEQDETNDPVATTIEISEIRMIGGSGTGTPETGSMTAVTGTIIDRAITGTSIQSTPGTI